MMPTFNYQKPENIKVNLRPKDVEGATEEKVRESTFKALKDHYPGKSFSWHIERADKYDDVIEVYITLTLNKE